MRLLWQKEVHTLKYLVAIKETKVLLLTQTIKVKAIEAKLAEAGALLIEPKARKTWDFDMSRFSLRS